MIKQASVYTTIKYIRLSPSKFSKFLKRLRNVSYKSALFFLKNCKHKIGLIIWKLLYSAIFNFINLYKMLKDNLYINEIYANQGSILKRFQPRAKGRAFKIEKKLSHLTISIITKN